MGRRQVFLIEDLGDAPGTTHEFVDQDDLDDLLEEGYEEVVRKDKTIRGVACTRITLTDGKELTVVEDTQPQGTRALMTQLADGLKNALSIPDSSSHLGAPLQSNIPGVQIVGASEIGQAFDAGLTACKLGKPLGENPWPTNTEPGNAWLKGYYMAQSDTPQTVTHNDEDLRNVEKEGYNMAINTARNESLSQIEVHCPYTGYMQKAWLKGFKRGGGSVE